VVELLKSALSVGINVGVDVGAGVRKVGALVYSQTSAIRRRRHDLRRRRRDPSTESSLKDCSMFNATEPEPDSEISTIGSATILVKKRKQKRAKTRMYAGFIELVQCL